MSNSMDSPTGEVLMVSPILEGEELLTKTSNGDSSSESQPAASSIDSEEEFFFDSKAWVGSDSDQDDFFSIVKGICDNSAIPGSASQDMSFTESPPLIKPNGSQYSDQEPPPTEQKKELVELLQDAFWRDILVRQKDVHVQFFKDWSWSEESITEPTSFSKTPCIVDSKSLDQSSTIELPSDITLQKNSVVGNERSRKDKSKSKKTKDRAASTRCCCCIPWFCHRLGFRK